MFGSCYEVSVSATNNKKPFVMINRNNEPWRWWGAAGAGPQSRSIVSGSPARYAGMTMSGFRPAMPVFSCVGSRVECCAGLTLSGFRPLTLREFQPPRCGVRAKGRGRGPLQSAPCASLRCSLTPPRQPHGPRGFAIPGSFRALSGIPAASSWPSRSVRRSGWRSTPPPVGPFSFFCVGLSGAL